MARHWSPFFMVPLALLSFGFAKDKKEILPAYVLQARTVLVVVDPNAGIASSNPTANRTAQEDVEKALMNWGRFKPVLDASTADLVICVRRGNGKAVNQTIGGTPNDRPVITEPINSGIRIGAQHGTPTPITDSSASPPPRPQPQTEIGTGEDEFIVYNGQVEYPLDSPALWRYVAKDALSSPSVPAVAQFQKAITETEKQIARQQQKKP